MLYDGQPLSYYGDRPEPEPSDPSDYEYTDGDEPREEDR